MESTEGVLFLRDVERTVGVSPCGAKRGAAALRMGKDTIYRYLPNTNSDQSDSARGNKPALPLVHRVTRRRGPATAAPPIQTSIGLLRETQRSPRIQGREGFGLD